MGTSESAIPLQEEIVLTPAEGGALLAQLRCGELFGLKWEDVDFHNAEIRIMWSIVDQVEGPPKTLASRRPLPAS